MEGHREISAPMLYTSVGGESTLVGVEPLMQSENIEDHRLAVNALRMYAGLLEQHPQLDNDPQGMYRTRHHLYGGPENAPIVADCHMARRFYTMPENSMYDLRRDIHTRIERLFGWFRLPGIEVIRDKVQNDERHVSTRTKKRLAKCATNDCIECPLRQRDE